MYFNFVIFIPNKCLIIYKNLWMNYIFTIFKEYANFEGSKGIKFFST